MVVLVGLDDLAEVNVLSEYFVNGVYVERSASLDICTRFRIRSFTSATK